MTALASLPTLAVSIAFNPTNLQSLTQTWTDVTTYVRDFTTSSGRQHFLDRIESSTIRLTLDNRTGYFLNGTTNGTGSVIRTRLPIKVTATTGGTTYPVFWGLTESAEERTADQLNQDILLTASDNTKYLSLLYMSKPTFYRNYVNAVVTTSTSSVTIATGSKTFTVPTLAAVPATGTAVSITATAVRGQAPIIAVGTVSAGTTSTSLVVNITNTFISGITAGPYTSWTIAIGSDMGYYTLNATGINDQILGNTLTINGIVDVTSPGALLYSPDTATDLSNNNATNNVASITLPQGVGYSTTIGSVDFWILGQTLASQSIMVWEDSSASSLHYLSVNASGELIDYNWTYGNTTHSNVKIVDGQWHHIGLYATSAGTISLYCDGVFTTLGGITVGQIVGLSYGLFIGNSVSAGNNYPSPAFPLTGLVSQLTIGAPYAQTSQSNILNRFKAGSLLNQVISSGDRIAEVLTLAGYGSITAGALVVPNYTVNDLPWNQSATITSIAGTGTTATATLASNPWTAGQSVFISGNTYSGSITNITWATGVATVTLTAAHAYTVGTNVTITGSSVAAYNGTWAVQSVGSTTWTFVSAYSSTPGTGTGGTTSGPSYYNGLFTVTTATSTTFAFSSTGTATITGGTASVNSTSTFSVQNLQSPVTSSTALDLIQQVTDTDVGAFFQKPDGSFEFDDQAYLYTATNNATPTGANVWSDTSNLAITSIVGTGTTATVTLSTAYNPYTSGQVVVITGNSVSSFNGSFTITSVGTTTFTFASITSATGTGGVATSQTTNYEPSTLQVLRDDADVWTTVNITAQNGTVQTYENTSAEPLYAYSTLTKSNVVSVTNEQALQEAIYLGNLYQSPLPRVGNVELRSETNNGANLAEMLTPYLNDQVRFIRSANGASAAGSINSTTVIESIRHDFQADPGYWHTSFTLDPFPKRGQNLSTPTFFMLFDDSTYGTFDTTNEYL